MGLQAGDGAGPGIVRQSVYDIYVWPPELTFRSHPRFVDDVVDGEAVPPGAEVGRSPEVVFKTLHLFSNSQIGPVCKSVCTWQAFPSWCNVTL